MNRIEVAHLKKGTVISLVVETISFTVRIAVVLNL